MPDNFLIQALKSDKKQSRERSVPKKEETTQPKTRLADFFLPTGFKATDLGTANVPEKRQHELKKINPEDPYHRIKLKDGNEVPRQQINYLHDEVGIPLQEKDYSEMNTQQYNEVLGRAKRITDNTRIDQAVDKAFSVTNFLKQKIAEMQTAKETPVRTTEDDLNDRMRQGTFDIKKEMLNQGIDPEKSYQKDKFESPLSVITDKIPDFGFDRRKYDKLDPKEKIDYMKELKVADDEKFKQYKESGITEKTDPTAKTYAKDVLSTFAKSYTAGLKSASGFGRVLGFRTKDNPQKEFLLQYANYLDKGIDKVLDEPGTRQTFGRDVVNGAGSLAAFLLPSAVASKVGISEMFVSTVLGALFNSGGEYDRVLKETGDERKALASLYINAGLGTTESLPIGQMFKGLNGLTGKNLFKMIGKRGLSGFFEEGIQEFGQQLGQDVTSNLLGTSKLSHTEIMSNSLYAGLLGGILGFGMNGAGIIGTAGLSKWKSKALNNDLSDSEQKSSIELLGMYKRIQSQFPGLLEKEQDGILTALDKKGIKYEINTIPGEEGTEIREIEIKDAETMSSAMKDMLTLLGDPAESQKLIDEANKKLGKDKPDEPPPPTAGAMEKIPVKKEVPAEVNAVSSKTIKDLAETKNKQIQGFNEDRIKPFEDKIKLLQDEYKTADRTEKSKITKAIKKLESQIAETKKESPASPVSDEQITSIAMSNNINLSNEKDRKSFVKLVNTILNKPKKADENKTLSQIIRETGEKLQLTKVNLESGKDTLKLESKLKNVHGVEMTSLETQNFDKWLSNSNIAMNTKTADERKSIANEWLAKNRSSESKLKQGQDLVKGFYELPEELQNKIIDATDSDTWRSNEKSIAKIKKAIRESVSDESEVERVFDLVKKKWEGYDKVGEWQKELKPKSSVKLPNDSKKPAKSYSSTQVNLPKTFAKPVVDMANSIPDTDLYEEKSDPYDNYGRETEPHITALYGLHTEDHEAVKKVIEGFGDVEVTLGKTSLFKNDKYDVLKVDVESPDLNRLNKFIAKNFDYTNDYDGYQPHVTIAYLKPGEGEKYAGDDRFLGKTFKLSELLFSDTDRNKTSIKLTNLNETSKKAENDTEKATANVNKPEEKSIPEGNTRFGKAKDILDKEVSELNALYQDEYYKIDQMQEKVQPKIDELKDKIKAIKGTGKDAKLKKAGLNKQLEEIESPIDQERAAIQNEWLQFFSELDDKAILLARSVGLDYGPNKEDWEPFLTDYSLDLTERPGIESNWDMSVGDAIKDLARYMKDSGDVEGKTAPEPDNALTKAENEIYSEAKSDFGKMIQGSTKTQLDDAVTGFGISAGKFANKYISPDKNQNLYKKIYNIYYDFFNTYNSKTKDKSLSDFIPPKKELPELDKEKLIGKIQSKNERRRVGMDIKDRIEADKVTDNLQKTFTKAKDESVILEKLIVDNVNTLVSKHNWKKEDAENNSRVIVDKVRAMANGRDYAKLSGWMNSLNGFSKKVFGVITGVKLPASDKETKEVLKKYVGEEEYQRYAETKEQESKARAEKQAEYDKAGIIKRLEQKKYKDNGKIVSAKELLDNRIESGYLDTKSRKVGAVNRYYIVKGNSSIELTGKDERDYALIKIAELKQGGKTTSEQESARKIAAGKITGSLVNRIEERGFEFVKGDLIKDSSYYYDLVGIITGSKADRLLNSGITVKKSGPDILVVKPGVAAEPKAKKLDDDIDSLLDDMIDLAGINEDPPIQSQADIGAQNTKLNELANTIVGKFINKGTYKFTDIFNAISEAKGRNVAEQLFTPMKKGYLAFRIDAGKDIRSKMDNGDYIEDLEIQDLAGGSGTSTGLETTGAVSKTSQKLPPSSDILAGFQELDALSNNMTEDGVDSKSMNINFVSQRTNFLSFFDSIITSQEQFTEYYDYLQSILPHVVNFYDKVNKVTGALFTMWRLKPLKSLKVKLSRKNANPDKPRPLGSMDDTIAASLIVETKEDIDKATEFLTNQLKGLVKLSTDNRTTPSFLGYGAVHLDVYLPSGQIIELQVHTFRDIISKSYAHDIYDKWRPYIESNGPDITVNDILDLMDDQGIKEEFIHDVQLSTDVYKGLIPVPDSYINKMIEGIDGRKSKFFGDMEAGKIFNESRDNILERLKDFKVGAVSELKNINLNEGITVKNGNVYRNDKLIYRSSKSKDLSLSKGEIKNETQRDKLPDETGANEDSEGSLANIPPGDVSGNAADGQVGTKPDPSSEPNTRGDAKGNKASNGKEQSDTANGGINSVGDSGSDVDNAGTSTGTGKRGKRTSGNTKRTKQDSTGNKQSLSNYRITDDSLITNKTFNPIKRAASNIAAIKLLKELTANNEIPTEEQKNILVQYVGWGGIANIFDETKPEWSDLRNQLKEILSDDEYTSARASTLNAHYTSPEVIRGIYKGLERLGVTGGRFIEPSMGTGHFYGLMPDSILNGKYTDLYGVEIDPLTGKIAQLLYGKTDITISGFENTNYPNNYFDVATSNVPFGDYGVTDSNVSPEFQKPIHNYFFVKTLNQVRKGGIIAFVTSRYSLDNKDASFKKHIKNNAKFLGAIRLPNTAFKGNAGTEVVTDIIFLQKEEGAKQEHHFDTTTQVELEGGDGNYTVNKYFIEHPEMVIGKLFAGRGRYGKDKTVDVEYSGNDFEGDLAKAMSNLPENVYENITPGKKIPKISKAVEELHAEAKNYKDGEFLIKDGDIYRKMYDSIHKVEFEDTPHQKILQDKIQKQIRLNQLAREILEQQLVSMDDSLWKKQAKELNKVYDEYVKKYGFLNDKKNVKVLYTKNYGDDPNRPFILSLENWDNEKNVAVKSDRFSVRTAFPDKTSFKIEDINDAITVVYNTRGYLDIPEIAKLLERDETSIIKELTAERKAYFDGTIKRWVPKEEYLAGDVKQKLNQAKEDYEKTNESHYLNNIEELTKVIPIDLSPQDIKFSMGVTWVGMDTYKQFISEVFDIPMSVVEDLYFSYNTPNAEWLLREGDKVDLSSYTKLFNEYGYQSDSGYTYYDGIELMALALNKKSPVIHYKDENGVSHKDPDKTVLATNKQKAITLAFDNWLYNDPERTAKLSKIYNDTFNNLISREYNGQHLSLPELNPEIRSRLFPHVKDAVWRIIQQRDVILAHGVGFGKTWSMTVASQELRRLGLANKPMHVVKNHMVGQYTKEYLLLYPKANVLVMYPGEINKMNRGIFLSRIANGNWDSVIVPYSVFKSLALSPEVYAEYYQQELDSLRVYLEEKKAEDQAAGLGRKRSLTVKRIEKMIKNLQTKLDNVMAKQGKGDPSVIPFEKLGVDQLFVDEAHNFKNLFFQTKKQLRGLPNTNAQQSMDMYLKIRTLRKEYGKGVVFATGTPVSNSMGELYTMMRYIQPGILEKYGISHFDKWIDTFGLVTRQPEINIVGNSITFKERLSRFINIPEIMTMFRQNADVKTKEDITLNVPEILNGEPTLVVSEPNTHIIDYLHSLDERYQSVMKGLDPTIDNPLKICTDGKKASVDLRLVGINVDHPDSKINKAVDEVARIYDESKENKGTQVVFLSYGIPKNIKDNKPKIKKYQELHKWVGELPLSKSELSDQLRNIKRKLDKEKKSKKYSDDVTQIHNFLKKKANILENILEEETYNRDVSLTGGDFHYSNVQRQITFTIGKLQDEIDNPPLDLYADMRNKLIKYHKIPKEQIAFIHEYETDAQKTQLYEDFNKGKVRILIATPQKVGEGTNIQRLLKAIHIISPPWRPADIEQMIGRMIRSGNLNAVTEILHYVQERSFDSYSWQLLAGKQRFVAQSMSKDISIRESEDIEERVLSDQEVSAIASGNPDILRRAALEQEVHNLLLSEREHLKEQQRVKSDLETIPKLITDYQTKIDFYTKQLPKTEIDEKFEISVLGETFKEDEVNPELDQYAEEIFGLKSRLKDYKGIVKKSETALQLLTEQDKKKDKLIESVYKESIAEYNSEMEQISKRIEELKDLMKVPSPRVLSGGNIIQFTNGIIEDFQFIGGNFKENGNAKEVYAKVGEYKNFDIIFYRSGWGQGYKLIGNNDSDYAKNFKPEIDENYLKSVKKGKDYKDSINKITNLMLAYRNLATSDVILDISASDNEVGLIRKITNEVNSIPEEIKKFQDNKAQKEKRLTSLEKYEAKPFRDAKKLAEVSAELEAITNRLDTGTKNDAAGSDRVKEDENEDDTDFLNGENKEDESDDENISSQRDTQINSPAFKKWFGDSKVVDKNGKPLVVYHGTPATSFTVFDKGKGYYFTPDKQAAEGYSYGEHPNLFEVYLSMQNPLIKDYEQKSDAWLQADVDDVMEEGYYDGIIAHNINDGSESYDQYVVFEPNQIKSAIGNRGTFSKINNDINFQKDVKTNVNNLVERLNNLIDATSKVKKSFPGIKVVYLDNEGVQRKAIELGHTPATRSDYQTDKAFYNPKDGSVYLNIDKADSSSAAHEIAGHVFMRMLKNTNYEMYRTGLMLAAKDTALIKETKEDYPHLSGDRLLDEALAQAQGKSFDELYQDMQGAERQKWIDRFKNWMKRVLDNIKARARAFFKNDPETLNRINNLPENPTLKDWTDALSKDILQGKKISGITSEQIRTRNPISSQISAYHGSPHEFNRFALEKIGTGEGNAAFGWGLYFTTKKSIANWYANKLAKPVPNPYSFYVNGKKYIDIGATRHVYAFVHDYLQGTLPKSAAINGLKDTLDRWQNLDNSFSSVGKAEKIRLIKVAIEGIENDTISLPPKKRHVYNVTLHKGKSPEQYDYLDWYKPLTESQKNKIIAQSEKEGLKDIPKHYRNHDRSAESPKSAVSLLKGLDLNGNNIYRFISNYFAAKENVTTNLVGSVLMMKDKEASMFLLRAGIDGIRYPANSLTASADESTSNYVVFDESAVDIDEHIAFQKDNKQIRSDYFKKFFGDWENDPKNSSKVINKKSGLPEPVYHYTAADDFLGFKRSNDDIGMHFGTVDQANSRGEEITRFNDNQPFGGRIIPVYLNIRNPLEIHDLGEWTAEDMILGIQDNDNLTQRQKDQFPEEWNYNWTNDKIVDLLKSFGYDGMKYRNTYESDKLSQIQKQVDDQLQKIQVETVRLANQKYKKLVLEKGEKFEVIKAVDQGYLIIDKYNNSSLVDTASNGVAANILMSKLRDRYIYTQLGNDVKSPKLTKLNSELQTLRKMTDKEKEQLLKHGDYSWIAFDNIQIKSAIGNSGAYNPNNWEMVAQKDTTGKKKSGTKGTGQSLTGKSSAKTSTKTSSGKTPPPPAAKQTPGANSQYIKTTNPKIEDMFKPRDTSAWNQKKSIAELISKLKDSFIYLRAVNVDPEIKPADRKEISYSIDKLRESMTNILKDKINNIIGEVFGDLEDQPNRSVNASVMNIGKYAGLKRLEAIYSDPDMAEQQQNLGLTLPEVMTGIAQIEKQMTVPEKAAYIKLRDILDDYGQELIKEGLIEESHDNYFPFRVLEFINKFNSLGTFSKRLQKIIPGSSKKFKGTGQVYDIDAVSVIMEHLTQNEKAIAYNKAEQEILQRFSDKSKKDKTTKKIEPGWTSYYFDPRRNFFNVKGLTDKAIADLLLSPTITDQELLDALKDFRAVGGLKGTEYIIPNGLAETLSDLYGTVMGGSIPIIGDLTKWWKRQMVGVIGLFNIVFHARNMRGDNTKVFGYYPETYKYLPQVDRFLSKKLSLAKKGFLNLIDITGGTKVLKTAYRPTTKAHIFTDAQFEQYWKEGIEAGTFSGQFSAEALSPSERELKTLFLKPGIRKNFREAMNKLKITKLLDGYEEVARMREAKIRFALYSYLRAVKGLSPAEAHTESATTMINYNHFTPLERKWFINLGIPFYSWKKGNIETMIKQLQQGSTSQRARVISMMILNGLINTVLAYWLYPDDEERLQNDRSKRWLSESFHIPTPFLDKNGNRIYIYDQTPMDDISNLINVSGNYGSLRKMIAGQQTLTDGMGDMMWNTVKGSYDEVIDATNPFPKLVFELSTNRNFFYGFPLWKEDDSGYNRFIKSGLYSLGILSRNYTSMRQQIVGTQDFDMKGMRLSGIPITSVDLSRSKTNFDEFNKMLMKERLKEISDMDKDVKALKEQMLKTKKPDDIKAYKTLYEQLTKIRSDTTSDIGKAWKEKNKIDNQKEKDTKELLKTVE